MTVGEEYTKKVYKEEINPSPLFMISTKKESGHEERSKQIHVLQQLLVRLGPPT